MSVASGSRHVEVAALALARQRAYHPEPYDGQESFVGRDEIVALAAAAGIGRGTRVLDLCCGIGGPGRLIARATGCRLYGVDLHPGALVLALNPRLEQLALGGKQLGGAVAGLVGLAIGAQQHDPLRGQEAIGQLADRGGPH